MATLSEKLLLTVLGQRRYGSLRYRRFPALGRAWGGPFNGQRWRCLLVAELIHKLQPSAIVETGTYLGTSTDWLAAFQIPIYTCEANVANFGFSRARMFGMPMVNMTLADSRTAIRQFLAGPLADKKKETLLFYLDAHWNDDLPLADEVTLIFDTCPNAVVLIDDFEVPGDGGYGYDDYGSGNALDAGYIAPLVAKYDLSVRYPVKPSSAETGAKRGCVVLFGAAMATEIATIALLGPASAEPGSGSA